MNLIPVVKIVRLEENFEFGTFGIMLIQTEVFCATLEPPDVFNQTNRSCIPAQQYMCRRYNSPNHGETFIIENVPGRDDVLLHPGNRVQDTLACVCLGEHFGKLKGDRAILNSGKTFENFMALMEGHDRFHLTIKEAY